MKVYKAKSINILLNLISVILFVIVVLFFSKSNNIAILVFTIIGFYLLSLFFSKKKVLTIRIDGFEKTVELNYRKYLIINKTEIYYFNNLKCTYQIEIGSRGIKRKEFRFYNRLNNELILKIIPRFEGWSDNDLEEIHNTIN